MSLKYKEKASLMHDQEVKEIREDIMATLEDSKKLAFETDNLKKLSALKARCEKMKTPRKTLIYDKDVAKIKYQENRDELVRQKRDKRQRIREFQS